MLQTVRAQLELLFDLDQSQTHNLQNTHSARREYPASFPLDQQQRLRVINQTQEYVTKANKIYRLNAPAPDILFDLKGRAAGMYRVKGNQRVIRYNPHIFAKYFQDNLQTTVPHEVAHYISDLLFDLRKIKPHGNEWKEIMRRFDANNSVTANYDLNGLPVRKQARHLYQCACRIHELSSTRHNRCLRGKATYHCRYCKTVLLPVAEDGQ